MSGSVKHLFIIFILTTLLSVSCKDVLSESKKDNRSELFSDSVEFLDINNFEKLFQVDTLNKNFIVRSYKEYYANKSLKSGVFSYDSLIRQYISIDTLNKTSIYKSYYRNGKIKEKSLHNDLGFSFGTQYHFNKNGKVDSVNLDKEYAFTFEMLKQKLLKEKNIDINKSKIIDDFFWRTYALRISKQNQMNEDGYFTNPSWEVTFDHPKDTTLRILLIYDAKTGKLLKENTFEKKQNVCGNEY